MGRRGRHGLAMDWMLLGSPARLHPGNYFQPKA